MNSSRAALFHQVLNKFEQSSAWPQQTIVEIVGEQCLVWRWRQTGSLLQHTHGGHSGGPQEGVRHLPAGSSWQHAGCCRNMESPKNTTQAPHKGRITRRLFTEQQEGRAGIYHHWGCGGKKQLGRQEGKNCRGLRAMMDLHTYISCSEFGPHNLQLQK